MRKLFCLIGDPVERSRSPVLHARAFSLLGVDAVYAPCRVQAHDLEAALFGLRALGVAGFNVTVPHKRAVAARVDVRAASSERSGSVNCVVREDERLVGHDTDGEGLLRALAARDVLIAGARAVVIGAGGSGAASVAALLGAGAAVTLLNRSLPRGQALAARFQGAQLEVHGLLDDDALAPQARAALAQATLVVHCTTVGHHSSAIAFDPGLLNGACVLVDLVYAGAPGAAPGDTELVMHARQRKLTVIDGVDVLVFQAIASLELWLGRQAGSLLSLQPALRAAAVEA